jgi:hypothetical protein
MATTIPAIKPLVTRYFPNILGHNFSRNGMSSAAHMKSLEPYPERTLKSPDPGFCSESEFVRIPSPALIASEKTAGVQAKSRPLILEPVVSAFSTYGKEEPARPIAELRRSCHMEGVSSNTSICSFDATWTPK